MDWQAVSDRLTRDDAIAMLKVSGVHVDILRRNKRYRAWDVRLADGYTFMIVDTGASRSDARTVELAHAIEREARRGT